MSRHAVWIGVLLSALMMSRQCVQAMFVEILPRRPLYQLGVPNQVVCSVFDCPDVPSISWSQPGDRPLTSAAIQTSGSRSVLTFDPTTVDHEGPLLCKVACGGEIKQNKSNVQVFSLPSTPVITGQDAIRLGAESALTCQVSNVYPAERLTLEWLREEDVLKSETGDAGASSVRSTLRFVAGDADSGTRMRCRATMDLRQLPPDRRSAESGFSVDVLYPPVAEVLSDVAEVMEGTPLTLSCSGEGNPEPRLSWSLRVSDGPPVLLSSNRTLFIAAAGPADSGRYECRAENSEGSNSTEVLVQVLGPPTNTNLTVEPGQEILEGENVTITCHSDGAPPPRLALRREGAELRSSDSASSLSFSLSTAQLEDSALYQCDASNQYGSRLVQASLSVRAHPLQVQVHPRAPATVLGSDLTLTCGASGCPQTPLITWLWTGRVRDRVQEVRDGKEGGEKTLHLEGLDLEDQQGLSCQVQCDSIIRTQDVQIQIYALPSEPVLEDPGPVLLGQEAVLRCHVASVFSAGHLKVSWSLAGAPLTSESFFFSGSIRNVTSLLFVLVRTERPVLTCLAELLTEAGDLWMSSSSSLPLEVHYAPRGTTLSASSDWKVLEGENVTVTCHSDGAPPPRLALRREGAELRSSDSASSLSFSLSAAQLEDSGLYQCDASNQYGSRLVNASLSVRGPPRGLWVEVLPAPVVQEGTDVSVLCRAAGSPPPAFTLSNLQGEEAPLSSANGHFLLPNVTRRDGGFYRLNATNDLGVLSTLFALRVRERSRSLPPYLNGAVVPALCACVGLAAAAAILLDFLRRSRKKGFYQLPQVAPPSA